MTSLREIIYTCVFWSPQLSGVEWSVHCHQGSFLVTEKPQEKYVILLLHTRLFVLSLSTLFYDARHTLHVIFRSVNETTRFLEGSDLGSVKR